MDKTFTESTDPNIIRLVDISEKAAKWVIQTQGCPFPNIPVDCFSITEVLRFHLLCSGGRVDDVTARWRFEQRGGFRCIDDPGVMFRQKRPDIMDHLATKTIYQLNVEDKLEILQVLIDQILTYASVRDIIDEKMEKARQDRADFRLSYAAIMKKEREEKFKMKEEKKVIQTKMKSKEEAEGKDESENTKLDDLDKEMAELSERNKEQLQIEFLRIAIASREVQCMPLGYDRAFRRYWVFKSVSGLFVEHNPQNVGSCIPGGTPCIDAMNMPDADTLDYMRRLFEDSNNKENLGNRTLPTDVLSTPVKNFVREGVQENKAAVARIGWTCTGDEKTCRVHGPPASTVWYCFTSETDVARLITSLNDRGFREHDLKEALTQERDRIIDKLLPQCPFAIPVAEKMDVETPSQVNIVIDLALRDQLLDLEYKITAGGLGSLKTGDIVAWRRMLEEGVLNEDIELQWPSEADIPELEKENEHMKEVMHSEYKFVEILDAVYNSRLNVASNVNCMKAALLQLEQSVTRKFFSRPLGCVKRAPGRKYTVKKPSDLVLKWEASLKRCTSLSQIFIHLVALEKSILWSKSLLKTNCKLCKTRADPEQMLLCDSCDKGFHTYCLTPKLKKIPEGDWHCPSCKPIQKEPKPKKVSKPNEPVEEEKKTVFGKCRVCLDKVPLITCDACSEGYHMACLEPPLRKIPRGRWSCHNCRRLSSVMKKGDGDEDSEAALRASHRRSARAASSRISQFAQQILSNNEDDEFADERNILNGDRKRKSRHSIEPVASDLPLDNAVLQEILEKLMRDKDAWPFLRPVTKHDVPDYHTIISNPMDFATIKHKLNMLQYRNNSEVLYDCNLVFENCFLYNKEESEIHLAGEKLKKMFDKLCRERHLFYIEEDISPSKQTKKRKK